MTPRVTAHLQSRPKGRIYHYSSQQGLLGILETREFWATKIQFMNDAEEFRHAIALAKAILERRQNELGRIDAIDCAIQHLPITETTDIFLACFSEVGDLLSQWRGYCPEGIGFSIGFDYQELEAVAIAQECFIGRCIYDMDTKNNLLEEIIDHFLGRASSQPVDSDGPIFQEFLMNFWVVAPLLKDPSFQEENEWRIISFPKSLKDALVGLRAGKSTLIPYFRLKLETMKKSALNEIEIIVSPNPNMNLALAGASALLTSKKLKGAVKASSVPFRGW